jgi:hypothetical protein
MPTELRNRITGRVGSAMTAVYRLEYRKTRFGPYVLAADQPS